MISWWVGIEGSLTADQACEALAMLFPDLDILHIDLDRDDLERTWPSLVFTVHRNNSEFSSVIDVHKFPGSVDEDTLQRVVCEIARRLARLINRRTICAGTLFSFKKRHDEISL